MNKTKLFQVGDFCFFLSYPTEIIPPDNFMTFAVSQGKASYFYTISLSCSIQRPDKSAIANREDIVIYSNQEFEMASDWFERQKRVLCLIPGEWE